MHPSLPLIPSKTLIAKRLAQCLNPQLPSGVHQKTIEVYSYIFTMIGRDGLAQDLALWTPGLTPVLSYASLTLKPHYLTLLERFYLPLSTSLRPALKSLILALLPGIDEEGGEYFDRTLVLMDKVKSGVEDDAYFWQCFLLATITSPGRRQGALAFLGKRLPTLDERKNIGAPEDTHDIAMDDGKGSEAEALVNPEPGLLVRAFCAGLGDEQLLVQRGFLDLLVGSLPLCCRILQERVSKSDLELLVTLAAGVVLRRDMSLNRRLWAWFLGPDGQDQRDTGYFYKYGLNSLVGGLIKMLDRAGETSATERAKPYRICLSLMDRWEVGSLVVPKLFLPVVESVRQYERSAPSKEVYAEVLRSARMFFDGVEATLIWEQILEKIVAAFSVENESEGEEILESVRFVIRTFNVREEEMVLVHAPMLVLAVLVELGRHATGGRGLKAKGFQITEELWQLVPDRAFMGTSLEEGLDNDMDNEEILKKIRRFYRRGQTTDSSGLVPPFPIGTVGKWILREATRAVENALEESDIGVRCQLLVNVIQKTPKFPESQESSQFITSLLLTLSSDRISFTALQGIANVVAAMYLKGYLSPRTIDSLILPIVKSIWDYLSPDTPKFHVEAVKALWGLQNVLGDRRIEAAVATVMTEGDIGGIYSFRSAEQGRKFGVLWTHSMNYTGGGGPEMVLTRPLFLFLDSLGDDGLEMAVFTRGWLQNLGSLNRYVIRGPYMVIFRQLMNFGAMIGCSASLLRSCSS